MNTLTLVLVIVAVLVLLGLLLAVRLVWQYEQGVLFRLGWFRGSRSHPADGTLSPAARAGTPVPMVSLRGAWCLPR
jgi:regulator of protease activity HflC (stomatin/prohibitin superfamily)